jgi:hypothetical protein
VSGNAHSELLGLSNISPITSVALPQHNTEVSITAGIVNSANLSTDWSLKLNLEQWFPGQPTPNVLSQTLNEHIQICSISLSDLISTTFSLHKIEKVCHCRKR